MADDTGARSHLFAEAEAEQPTPRQTIDINYIKSHNFRELACDGVVGGPTPNGKLWLSFYTERLPLPRVVRHTLISGGQDAGFSVDPDNPGVPLEAREGIIRNVEFGLYLSIETAKELRDWLTRHINENSGEAS